MSWWSGFNKFSLSMNHSRTLSTLTRHKKSISFLDFCFRQFTKSWVYYGVWTVNVSSSSRLAPRVPLGDFLFWTIVYSETLPGLLFCFSVYFTVGTFVSRLSPGRSRIPGSERNKLYLFVEECKDLSLERSGRDTKRKVEITWRKTRVLYMQTNRDP